MASIDTLIVGAGQAGLAMSRCLSERGIDHVVIERGRVAERWRSERWDSLRLLTPNWQSRLPGFRYEGPDPDGYMTMAEVTEYLERYARSFDAPVRGDTTVLSVDASGPGFAVTTDRGWWQARNVVIATGYCDVPRVPTMATRLPARITQVTAASYRRPGQLAAGGVLVVGASASGVQIADEIHASGRPVTIAVGRHTRLPRRYRGKDILWWFDVMGFLDSTPDDVFDIGVSRHQPSFQLVGRPDHATLDLAAMRSRGVVVAGRVTDIDGTKVSLADDLVATTAAADVKLATLLARIDEFVERKGLQGDVEEAEPFTPAWPAFTDARTSLDLRDEGISTVVWATGFRRSYHWLKVPVLDQDGELRHHGGVTRQPGLYALGLQFMRRRKSAFIDGVGDDARELTEHLARRPLPTRMAVA
jgi:putative flavoprotein involved in K+ transport